jgi:HEAT repeat protein
MMPSSWGVSPVVSVSVLLYKKARLTKKQEVGMWRSLRVSGVVFALLVACASGAAPKQETEWLGPYEKSRPALIRLLERKDESGRILALATLAVMGRKAKPAVPAIVKTLNDPKGRVRIEAALTLLYLDVETEAAVGALREALREADPDTRARAAGAWRTLLRPAIAFSCWGPGPPPPFTRLELAKRAVPELLAALQDPVKEVRVAAAGSLSCIRADPKEVVPALRKALADREALVRRAANEALGELGAAARPAGPDLVRALQDRDLGVRLAAAGALRQIDSGAFVKSALPVLVAIIREDRSRNWAEGDNRGVAISLLGAAGPVALPTLCKLLRDRDLSVRCAAAGSLCELGPKAKPAVGALAAALRDSNYRVRGMAAWALGSIGPEAAAAVPGLIKALDDEEDYVRSRAADALGWVGPKAKAAVPALLRAVKKDEEPGHSFLAESAAESLGRIGADAETVVPALLAALKHKNQQIRKGAATGLGEFRGQEKAAIPALLRALHDEDDYGVGTAASGGLKRMGPRAVETAVAALTRSLESKDETVRVRVAYALAELDSKGKSVPALVRVVRSDVLRPRRAAIRALGAMGPKAKNAVPALRDALKDRNEDVRSCAADALERIAPEAEDRGEER